MFELDGGAVIAVIFVALAVPKILRGPVGQALAERLRGTAPPTDADVLAETDGLKARVAELEERLDFAERLLARSEQADQLPGGAQR